MPEIKPERPARYNLTKSREENATILGIKNNHILADMRRAAQNEASEMLEKSEKVPAGPGEGLPETGGEAACSPRWATGGLPADSWNLHGFVMYLETFARLYIRGIVSENEFTEFTRTLREAKTLYEAGMLKEKMAREPPAEDSETG